MIDLRKLGTITSGYGARRAPTEGASTFHKGLDIVLDDKNIPSVAAGTVSYVGYSDSGGYTIKIKQDDGALATYMHMAEQSSLNVGDSVKEGDIVGIMGNTGISTGEHLHIQFTDSNGDTLDPVAYFETGDGTNTDWFIENDDNSGGFIMGLVGKIIYFVSLLLLFVLAAYLFMKAFDIKIM